MKPQLIMLAGPNGAGKSTFFRADLSELGLPFLNPHILAAETGLDSYDAAAQIADMRRILIGRRTGFITETVLSDPVGAKVGDLAQAVDAVDTMLAAHFPLAEGQANPNELPDKPYLG